MFTLLSFRQRIQVVNKRHSWLIAACLLCLTLAGCAATLPKETDVGSQTYQRDLDYWTQGFQRSYRVHVPPVYHTQKPLPLVVVVHGAFDTAKGMEEFSGFSKLADRDMSGSFPVTVVMATNEEDYFEKPEHLAAIAGLQKFLSTLAKVDKTISFADYLKLTNYASNRFEKQYYTLPEEGFEVRMLMNSYKSLLGMDMFTRFMATDLSTTNVVLLTHISSSREFLSIREQILTYARQNFPREISWDVTGFGIVISSSSHHLTTGQIKSLAFTMIFVFGIMYLLFLSTKVGLISIVPNFFPIVINFGLMGWLGIELSMATSLIASIAIGLAVDDTIHYLYRFNREFKKDLDEPRAIETTLRHIGKPIIYTTLTISIGFSVLCFSSFNATAIFGLMMVVTMISALVGDLILLPSLMQHVELVTLWDLVRLKLGRDPRHGIPLFKGLSRSQVHYIIMAGSLREIQSGEILFQKGNTSDTMYAVISGSLDVVDHATNQKSFKAIDIQKQITTLEKGDVVGEMGLIRTTTRSATVVASQPSELLQINWKMIKRLQYLYPPIGHKFYSNLLTIICNRLDMATHNLYDESTVDDLTGLYNQRGFMRLLEVETNRCLRYQENLALSLINIDLHCETEETFLGTRESVFKDLGRTLSHGIRGCDILGRIDRQTFAVLIPQTTLQQARNVCRRLENQIKKERIDACGVQASITSASVGVSNGGGGDSGTELLSKAFEAMKMVQNPL